LKLETADAEILSQESLDSH